MRILITGSTGLLGSHIADALFRQGYLIRCLARPSGHSTPRDPRFEYIFADLKELTSPPAWVRLLNNVDVVVNAAGIFGEAIGQSFDVVHSQAPIALFAACVDAGISNIIQISALGADSQATSRFHLSKKTADDFLAHLPIRHTIIQPSLIFSAHGASTQLFADVAHLPLLFIPDQGRASVQPVHIDDVVHAVERAIRAPAAPQYLPAVGSAAMTMAQYLNAFRAGFGRRPASIVSLPTPLVRLGSRVMGMPLAEDSLTLLKRDNTAQSDAMERLLGRPPRPVWQFFTREVVFALQRRFTDRIYLTAMRFSVALVWIVTAFVSAFMYPVEDSLALLARVGLHGNAGLIALFGAAASDLALGAATLLVTHRRFLWRLQALLILGYTAIISIWLPEFWFHPYGPVLKNIPMLAMIGYLYRREAP